MKHHSSAMDHNLKKPPPPIFPRTIRGLDDRENVAMVEGEERRKLMNLALSSFLKCKFYIYICANCDKERFNPLLMVFLLSYLYSKVPNIVWLLSDKKIN